MNLSNITLKGITQHKCGIAKEYGENYGIIGKKVYSIIINNNDNFHLVDYFTTKKELNKFLNKNKLEIVEEIDTTKDEIFSLKFIENDTINY